MNFVRGIDPKRSMKIGIVTWNNLSVGCFVRTKRWVLLTNYNGGIFRFASDRAIETAHIGMETLIIESIERKKSGIIKIKFQNNSFIIEGSIERFRKFFEIIQER